MNCSSLLFKRNFASSMSSQTWNKRNQGLTDYILVNLLQYLKASMTNHPIIQTRIPIGLATLYLNKQTKKYDN